MNTKNTDKSNDATTAEETVIDVTATEIKKAPRCNGVSWLALLVAIGALGVSGHLYNELLFKKSNSNIDFKTPSIASDDVETLQMLIQNNKEALEEAKAEFSNIINDLKENSHSKDTQELLKEKSPKITQEALTPSEENQTIVQGKEPQETVDIIALKEEVASLKNALERTQKEHAAQVKALTAESSDISLEEAEQLLQKLRYERAASDLVAAQKEGKKTLKTFLITLPALDASNAPLHSNVASMEPQLDALYTRAALTKTFEQATEEALAIRVEGEGWWQEQVNKLAKLIKVEKIDASETSIDGKISAARDALKRGHISKAITIIQSLPAPAFTYFETWVPQAQSYVKAKRTFNKLLKTLQSPPADTSVQTLPKTAPNTEEETAKPEPTTTGSKQRNPSENTPSLTDE